MPDRMRGVKSDSPEQESTDDALKRIVGGLRHFRWEVFPEQQTLFEKLTNSQRPRAIFIICADSCIVLELIIQSSPDDLFIARNVDNVVPPYEQMNGGASTIIEYTVLALGAHHITVCGYSDCGAMRAMLSPQTLEHMPTVKIWLRHAEMAHTMVADNCDCGVGHDTLGVLTEESVMAQLDHLHTHPSVAPRPVSGQLLIHNQVYGIESAQTHAYSARQGRFLSLDGKHPVPMTTPAPHYLDS